MQWFPKVVRETGSALQKQPAVSSHLKGGQTWIDREEFADVKWFFSASPDTLKGVEKNFIKLQNQSENSKKRKIE